MTMLASSPASRPATKATVLEQACALSPQDRWELVGELTDSLDPGYTRSEYALAEEGLQYFRDHPDDVHDWDEVMTQLRQRLA